jgi:hypothetical protein
LDFIELCSNIPKQPLTTNALKPKAAKLYKKKKTHDKRIKAEGFLELRSNKTMAPQI